RTDPIEPGQPQGIAPTHTSIVGQGNRKGLPLPIRIGKRRRGGACPRPAAYRKTLDNTSIGNRRFCLCKSSFAAMSGTYGKASRASARPPPILHAAPCPYGSIQHGDDRGRASARHCPYGTDIAVPCPASHRTPNTSKRVAPCWTGTVGARGWAAMGRGPRACPAAAAPAMFDRTRRGNALRLPCCGPHYDCPDR